MAIGQLPPLSKLLCCAVLAGDVVKSSTTSSRAHHLASLSLALPFLFLQLERERAEPSHGCPSTPHAEPPSELAPSSTKPLGPLTTSPGTSLSFQTAAPATFIAGTELDIAARASVRGRSSSGHRFHCPTAQIDCT